MLVFPIVAYFVLPSQWYLKELFIAYTVNYGGGAICYILFIAYGPRKVIATVQEPMSDHFQEVTTVTAAVNSSANVFPSLHVSLTVTVWLLAWRTRDEYGLWIYNIENRTTTSVNRIADIVSNEMGVNPSYEYTGGDRGWCGDIPKTHLSIAKLEALG
jgi:nucleoside-diphosphate-sugar epimerase